jgi:hypothetical protein
LRTHHDWTQAFLASPTGLGVIDTYGIELIHPIREGRSPQQIGRTGLSHHRWIVGGKLCLLIGIGRSLAAPPSHTTWHTGPYQGGSVWLPVVVSTESD